MHAAQNINIWICILQLAQMMKKLMKNIKLDGWSIKSKIK